MKTLFEWIFQGRALFQARRGATVSRRYAAGARAARASHASWRRHNLGGRTAQRALAAHSMDLLHATESAVALDKCQNRIRLFGGVSRFQREQAMNEDIDLSIWRAPMESAIYRAARSIGQLASKEAVDY